MTKFKLDYSYKAIFSSTVLVNILKPCLVLWLMGVYEDPIFAILFGLSSAHLIAFLSFLPFSLKANPIIFSLGNLKSSLSFSKWFVPGAYFGVIINFMDRFLLAHFIGLTEVGIYSLAYKVGDLIKQFFINAFSAVLLPLKFSKENSGLDFSNKMNQLFKIYIILGLGLVLAINAVSEIFIQVLGGSSYASAALVVPFILIGHISFGLIGFLNTGYLVTNRSKYGLATLAVGSVVNLVLNLILIPKYSSVGAALATLVSFLATLPVAYYYACKFHELRFKIKDKTYIFIIFSLLITSQVLVGQNIHELYYSAGLQILIGCLYLALVYVFLPPKDKNKLRAFINR